MSTCFYLFDQQCQKPCQNIPDRTATSDHDSLPSLSQSASTYENPAFCGFNMGSKHQEDINVVLDDVIVKINRITEHLRGAGENEAANHFTREMTSTFRSLYNVIAPWDMEKCLMDSPAKDRYSTYSTTAIETRPRDNTWASVAATEPLADKSRIVEFERNDAVKQHVGNSDCQNVDHSDVDQRVVWIRPWDRSQPLSQVSKAMSELGAVYSIAFVPEEEAVCIIFQHAWCATHFIQHCSSRTSRLLISPFGKKYEFSPGLPYAVDEGLRKMDPPYNERRRLTFARAQLFSNGLTESRFRKDIEDVVGNSNVELLWLFNTGNATVIFSAVPLAKMVKEKFLQYSRTKKNPYEGLMVSYSHDPCERDLNLVSQIPGHANFIGGNGNGHRPSFSRSVRSSTFSNEPAAPRRLSTDSSESPGGIKRRSTILKSQTDADGWQMVKKRR